MSKQQCMVLRRHLAPLKNEFLDNLLEQADIIRGHLEAAIATCERCGEDMAMAKQSLSEFKQLERAALVQADKELDGVPSYGRYQSE